MPRFSKSSLNKLNTCDLRLQDVLDQIIKDHDCTILYGARTVEEQRKLVEEGKSRTMNSKHIPGEDGFSKAVDVAPYPIDWKNTKRYYYFAGLVMREAENQGVKLRWGGDWDRDDDLDDQTFMDLVHFEIVD